MRCDAHHSWSVAGCGRVIDVWPGPASLQQLGAPGTTVWAVPPSTAATTAPMCWATWAGSHSNETGRTDYRCILRSGSARLSAARRLASTTFV
jgi:hypothetical protein